MNDKVECFRKLYRAHEKIAYIDESIQRLYSSITLSSPKIDGMPKSPSNPHRFENTMIKILALKEQSELLLYQRATFDLFLCELPPIQERLLKLRCDDCLAWKETASALDISIDTAKRYFKKICERAEEKGIFSIPEE